MFEFVEKIKRKIIPSASSSGDDEIKVKDIDYKIILGVLLWAVGAVAEADTKFLPEEEDEIKEILSTYIKVNDKDFPVVISAIRQAALEGVDFRHFARQAGNSLSYEVKVSIVEDLFRVACSDRNLDNRELKIIKEVADLFDVRQKDFTASKTKIEKEFGI